MPEQVQESNIDTSVHCHKASRDDKNLPLDLLPQAQVEPEGLVFSSLEREQVQAPAARWLQEQRAPEIWFSVWLFSQLQCMAGCLPQEQVASFAQTQPPSRPQQVTGTAATGADIVTVGGLVAVAWLEVRLIEEED